MRGHYPGPHRIEVRDKRRGMSEAVLEIRYRVIWICKFGVVILCGDDYFQWQQFVDLGDGMICDVHQDLVETEPKVEAVELVGSEHLATGGSAFPSGVVAGVQEVLRLRAATRNGPSALASAQIVSLVGTGGCEFNAHLR